MICARNIESLAFGKGLSSLFQNRGMLKSFMIMESEFSTGSKNDIPSWKKRTASENSRGDSISQDSIRTRKNSPMTDNSFSNSQTSNAPPNLQRRSSIQPDTKVARSPATNYGYRKRPDFSRDQKNEFYANEYGREERGEPSYGYFDGDHVFGISPVRLALISKKRKVTELLMQTGMDSNNKKDLKSVNEILNLCQKNDVPVREFTKHDLNMLTDSRPHQGFVLRATPRSFIPIDSLASSSEFKYVVCVCCILSRIYFILFVNLFVIVFYI